MKEELILNVIREAGRPVRPRDIAQILGMDSKAVSKILSALKDEGKVISPRRFYYVAA